MEDLQARLDRAFLVTLGYGGVDDIQLFHRLAAPLAGKAAGGIPPPTEAGLRLLEEALREGRAAAADVRAFARLVAGVLRAQQRETRAARQILRRISGEAPPIK